MSVRSPLTCESPVLLLYNTTFFFFLLIFDCIDTVALRLNRHTRQAAVLSSAIHNAVFGRLVNAHFIEKRRVELTHGQLVLHLTPDKHGDIFSRTITMIMMSR